MSLNDEMLFIAMGAFVIFVLVVVIVDSISRRKRNGE
jgi:hypothetical protein